MSEYVSTKEIDNITREIESLKESVSKASLLSHDDSASILSRVESFTSEPKPALALVQFAERVCSLAQHKPQQRLVWSKQSARCKGQSKSALASSEMFGQPPAVPPNTGSAQSARRPFRRPRPNEMRSAPVTPRAPSAPSKAPPPSVGSTHGEDSSSATDDTGVVVSMAAISHHAWPHMANVAHRARVRQSRGGRGIAGRGGRRELISSKPQTASSEPLPRTPSTPGLLRLAQACTEAGLFIIPDAPLPLPQNITRDSPDFNTSQVAASPEPVPEEAEMKPDNAGLHKIVSLLGRIMPKSPSNTPSARSPPAIDHPRQGQEPAERERPSMQRWSLAVNRLMEERGSTMSLRTEGTAEAKGQLQEVIRQVMTKEQKEQPKAEHRDREKRLRWQQQHTQQLSQLQELIKTLQQLQPQEQTQEIAEPLQMLKKMMGMGDNKEAKEEEKEAQKEEKESDSPPEHEGPRFDIIRSDERQSLSNRKLRFDANSLEHRNPEPRGTVQPLPALPLIGDDPCDLSLPPLCGDVGRASRLTRKGSFNNKEEACTLARSCHTRKRRRHQARHGSPVTGDSDESHEEEDIPMEHEVGRIFRKFKKSEEIYSARKSSGASSEGAGKIDIKKKWKKNLALVKMFGRLSTHQNAMSHFSEEFDLMHELASVNHLLSHDEALRLSSQYNLPAERVVKCRKLFARFDKDNRGELGPEELQQVLREMWKDLHPKSTVLPHALFSSPSTWGSRTKFTEVLRWLSRHAFDEASLVPPEQQRARELARQWGVPVSDVEEVKDLFDRFDTEKKGSLDFVKFKSAMTVILKVPRGAEVPASRVNIYWKEVDRDKTGAVSFEKFFWWYQRSGFQESATRQSFAGATSLPVSFFGRS